MFTGIKYVAAVQAVALAAQSDDGQPCQQGLVAALQLLHHPRQLQRHSGGRHLLDIPGTGEADGVSDGADGVSDERMLLRGSQLRSHDAATKKKAPLQRISSTRALLTREDTGEKAPTPEELKTSETAFIATIDETTGKEEPTKSQLEKLAETAKRYLWAHGDLPKSEWEHPDLPKRAELHFTQAPSVLIQMALLCVGVDAHQYTASQRWEKVKLLGKVAGDRMQNGAKRSAKALAKAFVYTPETSTGLPYPTQVPLLLARMATLPLPWNKVDDKMKELNNWADNKAPVAVEQKRGNQENRALPARQRLARRGKKLFRGALDASHQDDAPIQDDHVATKSRLASLFGMF